MVDLAPYTAWSWFTGQVEASNGTMEVEDTRGTIGVGLHWEYNPIPYIGVGVKLDVQIPVGDPRFLMALPTLAMRGILPLMDGRLELFAMVQFGVTYLQYGDYFVGYGWNVSGGLGAGYQITRRWGLQLHVDYQYLTAYQGDYKIEQAVGTRGFFGFYYKL